MVKVQVQESDKGHDSSLESLQGNHPSGNSRSFKGGNLYGGRIQFLIATLLDKTDE